MSHHKSFIGILALVVPALAHAQTFEVASIKPTDPSFTLRSIQMPLNDGIVAIRGLSLKELIQYAWGNVGAGTGLHPNLVAGGPAWAGHDRYDIVARPEGSRTPSRAERKQMLQALLVERFQLRFHRETRQTPVYALVAGKNGPRMKERKPDDGGAPFSLPIIGLHMQARNVSMAQFADILQTIIPLTDPDHEDLPVLDQTGLSGTFDFDLKWSGDPSLSGGRGVPPADPASAPDLLTAIEEQLGLRLEARKASVQILVIDRAERPSAN